MMYAYWLRCEVWATTAAGVASARNAVETIPIFEL